MSWDLSFCAADSPPPPVEKMPSDWEGSPFGILAEVRNKISACLPAVNWSDPEWGRYKGPGYSLEFNIGKDDSSYGFMVHVRGSGDAVSELLKIAEKYNWYVLDTPQGEWLHHCHDQHSGWREFQEYRDRILGLKK